MMHSEESAWLEDEKATGFIKYYKDRKYAFLALLPNEGVSMAQYMEEIKEVILNRPFVYMLIDSEINLPFFMGTMMDMEAN